MAGKLYLVATPIGNLEDITLRALNILNEADVIAAEDTRNSIKLLNHFEIKTPMTSYHEYNKFSKAQTLIRQMQEGKNIALITDAGTPGISDPGEELVKMCIENGIEVTSTPGATACITALIISGMSTRRFCFEGFLPKNKKEKQQVLDSLVNEMRTIVMYEAPHHIKATLEDLKNALGDREIVVCRELTKKYETALRTTFSGAIAHFEETMPRGECVIVIKGRDRAQLEEEVRKGWEELSIEEHMEHYTRKDIPKKEAMKMVAKDRGISKRDVYQYLNKE